MHELTEQLAEAIGNNNVQKVCNILVHPEKINFFATYSFKSRNGIITGTVMLVACAYGNAEIVQALIKAGAPLGLQDWSAARLDSRIQIPFVTSPLHIAASYGHLHLIEMLVAAEADIELINGCNNTPLASIFFTYYGETSIIEVMDKLIALGANINPTTSKTPLRNFIGYNTINSIPILENFFKHGVNVNQKAPDGITPLVAAIIGGRSNETILFLLAHGADYREQFRHPESARERLLSDLKSSERYPTKFTQSLRDLLTEMDKIIVKRVKTCKEIVFNLYRGQKQENSKLSIFPYDIIRHISEYIAYNAGLNLETPSVTDQNPKIFEKENIKSFVDSVENTLLPSSYLKRLTIERELKELREIGAIGIINNPVEHKLWVDSMNSGANSLFRRDKSGAGYGF
jgi:ankyrin repeat protein